MQLRFCNQVCSFNYTCFYNSAKRGGNPSVAPNFGSNIRANGIVACADATISARVTRPLTSRTFAATTKGLCSSHFTSAPAARSGTGTH